MHSTRVRFSQGIWPSHLPQVRPSSSSSGARNAVDVSFHSPASPTHPGTHLYEHLLVVQSPRTSPSSSGHIEPPSTEAPLRPRQPPSQLQPRTQSVNPTLGTSYKKPIQPKILEEELLDYQKLHDDMAANPTHVTLACLQSLAAAPSTSGKKRSRATPTEGEGEIEDARVSGSGGHQAANASGAADPAQLPTQDLTG